MGMRAGVIGIIDGTFDEIEPFHESVEQDGREFDRCIEIRNTKTTDRTNTKVQVGRAALQRIEERERVDINDGKVSVVEQPEKVSKYTEFITVPGEFVAVRSGSGTFAFDLIQARTQTTIERTNFDLNAFSEEYDSSDQWQVGFYGNIGNAEKGVIYGEEVLDDSEVGDTVERSQKNQLGLQYPYNDNKIKMTISESGYIEVYQPSNYDEFDFAEYVMEEILPFVNTVDDKEREIAQA
jgi:hypothetical protein